MRIDHGSDSPRYTVIMASYNGEQTIGRSILSILAQTYESFELLVVDDNSSDTTRKIVSGFERQDGRVRLIALSKNSGGPATPKNAGIAAARGEIFVFCDQDDTYRADRLEVVDKMLSICPSADVLFHDYLYVEEGRLMVESSPAYLAEKRAFLTTASSYLHHVEGDLFECRNFLACMCRGIETGMATISIAVRRTALMKQRIWFSDSYRVVDDIDLWYRLAADCRLFYLNQPLSTYYSYSSSASSGTIRTTLEAVEFHRVNLSRFKSRLSVADIADYRRLLSRLYFRLGKAHLHSPSESFGFAWSSFSMAPSVANVKMLVETSLRRIGLWTKH